MIIRLLGRRTLLGSAVAAMGPQAGRADLLQRVDLLIDWKPGPTYAGFYIAREAKRDGVWSLSD